MTIIAVLEGSAFCAGTAMGVASVLSVGPNNIMLLREGLVRGRVRVVAITVWISYFILLASALGLTDKIAQQGSSVRPILSYFGLLAIVWFAISSLRAYRQPSSTFQAGTRKTESLAACMRRVLLVVWLNPLTYVELLFIPAAMGGNFIMPACRYLFIAGLIMMATAACFGYSFCGSLFAPLFARKNFIRVFDLASGIILSCMACIMAAALVLRPS